MVELTIEQAEGIAEILSYDAADSTDNAEIVLLLRQLRSVILKAEMQKAKEEFFASAVVNSPGFRVLFKEP